LAAYRGVVLDGAPLAAQAKEDDRSDAVGRLAGMTDEIGSEAAEDRKLDE